MAFDRSSVTGNWNYPTTMRFGPGRIRELPALCGELGMTRPLLVTDPGLADLPMVRDALAHNDAAGVPTGLFSAVKGNPTGGNVEAGVVAFRAGRHDGVIGFGGGSALDAAKSIALMVGQNRPIWDFEDVGDNWKRVNVSAMAPILAVPTTAGTGSEVGRASVIVNEETHEKKIIFHPKMQPRIVLSDPELTLGLPPFLTAATGFDALAHCFEAICAPGYHPMADGIGFEGLRLVARWLPIAHADGTNLEARSHMLIAASMGATAFQKGLGAVHSISHPVGAIYDTHHGLTNAVMLPYVLAFNRRAVTEPMNHLARVLELPTGGVDGVMAWLLDLRERLGVPHTLAALGVPADRADEIAEMAAADPSTGSNPVPAGAKEMKAMFLDAVHGRVS